MTYALLLLSLLPFAARADVDVFLPPHTGSQGCWARVFEQENYAGKSVQLAGPTYIEAFRDQAVPELELKEVGGADFMNRIDSLVVGPNAKVTVYEEESYSGVELVLEPGTRIADLQTVNFADRIESLQLDCVER